MLCGTVCHAFYILLISTSEDWSDNGWQEAPTIDAQVEYREESSPLPVLHREIMSVTLCHVLQICYAILDMMCN